MTESVRDGGFPPTVSGTRSSTLSGAERQRDGDYVRSADPRVRPRTADDELLGVDPANLGEEDLIREMHSLHRTRLDALRHAGDSALANHLRRTAELETEYLTRHPGREVDPHRLRDGG